MKEIVKIITQNKAITLPILSFPSVQRIDCTVRELVSNSAKQAQGMAYIANNYNVAAALNMMDLSVEAEAFGASIRYDDHEVPTVDRGIITAIEQAADIVLPQADAGRAGVFCEGIRLAKKQTDKPVLCGAIGVYSLACRLFDMSELMMACFDQPEDVHILLDKCASFITKYIQALAAAGADGVIMAEPAAGLLSPDFCQEFSTDYIKRIKAQLPESFAFVYHNCGNVLPLQQSICDIDADIYHFGNAVDIEDMLKAMPKDKPVMGNINPVFFRNNTAEFVYQQTTDLLNRCDRYANFVISSGCDIPADSKWENIEAYFAAVADFYNR